MFEAEARSVYFTLHSFTGHGEHSTFLYEPITAILMVVTPMPSCKEPTIIVGFL